MSETQAIANRLTADQLRMVYKHLPMAVLPPILAALLVAFLLSDQLPFERLRLWVVWVAVSYLLFPAMLCLLYRRRADLETNPGYWGRGYVIMAMITAASWGGAGVLLFVPGSLLLQVFVGAMLFTSAAAVMATTFPYTPAYYAGALPILLPLVYSFQQQGDIISLTIAAIILASFMMLSYFQFNMNRSLSESLLLRYEREQLVAELEQKNVEIVRANQSKSRFLAAASHDIRQPMHAQHLLLGELSARLDKPEDRAIVDLLRQSMVSMRTLLDGLLEVSRLDAGSIEVHKRDFDLLPLIHRLEHEFKSLMQEKGLIFRVARCQVTVHSDPALLERILRNLLHNAIRYTTDGAVMLACRRRGAGVAIEIRDSGPGIPSSLHEQIFEEFYQLGNKARQRTAGQGLGLSIVRRLVDLLGHRLALRSAPDQGSTFSLWLPLSDRAAASPAVNSETVVQAALAGLRVVVIDDDPAVLTAMQLPLLRWGCSACLTPDPRQALQQIEQGVLHPDVIVTDYRLADGETGLHWARRLCLAAATTPKIIVLTGDSAPDCLREVRSSGALLMHKPVATEVLYALLSNIHSTITTS